MQVSQNGRVTAFAGSKMVAQGELAAVASAAHARRDESLLIFDDATGQTVELDLRGAVEDVLARLGPPTPASKPVRGRPRLGVTAREVTLLPRHWDWLATQPGGASATLRRLVDQARGQSGGANAIRQAQEATYQIMTTLAGDLPGYEEAVRALFALDLARFDALTAPWPTDVGDYVRRLSARANAPSL